MNNIGIIDRSVTLVGDRKRNSFFLQKAEREHLFKCHFCRNTDRTERVYFCRMSIYLPKECLSAERVLGRRTEDGDFVEVFCKMDASAMPIKIMDVQKEVLLPKECLSVEIRPFCRRTERRFEHRNSFCRISSEIFCRNSAFRQFRSPTISFAQPCTHHHVRCVM